MSSTDRIEIFVEVARQQSFAKAAKILGITGPSASKQVQALEDRIGVKLLHRTTRLVTLTDEGASYYERARHAIEELKEAAAQVQEMKTSPRGNLRINVPLSFGHLHLLPTLAGFAAKYPDLSLDITLDDRTVDVIAEGFDLVIRIGVLADSSLIAKPLSHCPIYPVASPAYLERHGTPKNPSDFKHHRLISYSYQGGITEWRYRGADGTIGAMRSEGILRANTAEMMREAALAGLGIAILPSFAVAPYIKSHQLVRLLPEYSTYPERQITALMPPNRHRSRKTQLLLDWITAACKAVPIDA